MSKTLEPIEALNYVKEIVDGLCDQKVRHSFYFEYGRRLFTLQTVSEFCPLGSTVVDLGASPFIVSCALSRMGYGVIAVDYNPGEYSVVASTCGVKVVKADLERDKLELQSGSADCVVFTEVLEHLNSYYVGSVMAEINRVLKPGGRLILTIHNIASFSGDLDFL